MHKATRRLSSPTLPSDVVLDDQRAVAAPHSPSVPPSPTFSLSDQYPRFTRDNRNNSLGRPPPSSFAFPFQAYPGNPDPGTHVPGAGRSSSTWSRSSSFDGAVRSPSYSQNSSNENNYPSDEEDSLARPQAPFMVNRRSGSTTDSTPVSMSPIHSRTNSLYRNSAAGSFNCLPNSSQVALDDSPPSAGSTMRAPFLSPSSRPTSTTPWQPPSYTLSPVQFDENGQPFSPQNPEASPSASSSFLPYGTIPKRTLQPSTLLTAPLSKKDKPWLNKTDVRGRISWWITFLCFALGACGAAAICYTGIRGVRQFSDSELCSVLDDNFNGNDLDSGWWNRVNELGGFGNGEFEMTTTESSFLSNGQLYFFPSLTSDDGTDIFHGDSYGLGDCTNSNNQSACSVSPSGNTIIPPVKSARISTKGKVSITYGKVEVKAKLPRGDWLWPAIWMLPDGYDDDAGGLGRGAYGYWPASGEIDIVEARGNDQTYKSQGNNFVRSSLNYGPMGSLLHQIYGWFSLKRETFSDSFHTYSMEWDSDFMRFYTDNKLHSMLDLRTRNEKESFWYRGGFPETAQNGSTKTVVSNPWSSQSSNANAPYDQPFYLIINLSVGGTSGWFPDGVGDKPWYDASESAMFDFAYAQDEWYSTWPSSQEDRSFRIEHVKMWQKC